MVFLVTYYTFNAIHLCGTIFHKVLKKKKGKVSVL